MIDWSDASSDEGPRRRKRTRRNPATADPAAADGALPSVAAEPPKASKVEFAIGPLVPDLTCRLCRGLFRDPFTVTECLHTFCKTCLYQSIGAGFGRCPKCNIDLGTDPWRCAMPDRAIQELVDKLLFPHLRDAEDVARKEFYQSRNIPNTADCEVGKDKDDEPITEESLFRGSAIIESTVEDPTDTEVEFIVLPHTDTDNKHAMPRLDRPFWKTSGKFKVIQIKKYLLRQLDIFDVPPTAVEIICKDYQYRGFQVLGNELSLAFIDRTRFSDEARLQLTYRFSEDYVS